MDKRLFDVLNQNEKNYLLPFYWQRGDHRHLIPEQVQRIYDSGCRALCVESRPHPDFCGDNWWCDFELILKECEKRGMKVWLLDDDKFPTGHAAGMIAKKYPELRQWELIERHIDVVGPAKNTSIIVDSDNEENILLGAFAYKRNADNLETCSYENIDLTNKIFGNYLTWDIPNGVYRIFFYYKSRTGGRKEYIDMINPKSVDVLIEAVYESHYAHFSKYFGNTFAGFFSDEPSFGNGVFGHQRANLGMYESRIGKHSLALPWNENVRNIMAEKLGYDPLPHLNLLWFEDCKNGDDQADIRYAYMDTVTKLYSKCFTKRLSDWCHDHGVMYIGHVIEDMNCHAHLGSGTGHYFRSLEHQDMSGIDIVLHQIMPGMEDYRHTSSASAGPYDGGFFHYVLAKLGASLAHLTPHMQGRAMCEVFGAYGYGEDTVLMKYLMDHLLVRGINHFVPHAFSSKFPDGDCPPHFGAEGHDPSFEGFSELMSYTNKAAHLLSGTTHIADVAILYHADNEWASRYMNAMNMEPAAKALYDAHIDYDIVTADMLADARVCDNKLCIANEKFGALIIPYCDHSTENILNSIKSLQDQGLLVIFVKALPENADFDAVALEADELAEYIRQRGLSAVMVNGDYPHLRIYHCKRDSSDIFMFFNEDYAKTVDTKVLLPCKGDYARVDILNNSYLAGTTDNYEIALKLLPNQSQIVIFGENSELEAEYEITESTVITPKFKLELASCDDLSKFEFAGEFDEFFNVNSPKFMTDFSGKMRYTFKFDANTNAKRIFIDLGNVGQNASLVLNGKDIGIRITKPYAFDITDAVIAKDNVAVVTVSNTLAQKVRDYFSRFLQLSPSGLLGEISIKYVK